MELFLPVINTFLGFLIAFPEEKIEQIVKIIERGIKIMVEMIH